MLSTGYYELDEDIVLDDKEYKKGELVWLCDSMIAGWSGTVRTRDGERHDVYIDESYYKHTPGYIYKNIFVKTQEIAQIDAKYNGELDELYAHKEDFDETLGNILVPVFAILFICTGVLSAGNPWWIPGWIISAVMLFCGAGFVLNAEGEMPLHLVFGLIFDSVICRIGLLFYHIFQRKKLERRRFLEKSYEKEIHDLYNAPAFADKTVAELIKDVDTILSLEDVYDEEFHGLHLIHTVKREVEYKDVSDYKVDLCNRWCDSGYSFEYYTY